MAKFEITSPDGKRFEVTAPDGASEDEILSFAQQQTGVQDDAKSDHVEQDNRSWTDAIKDSGKAIMGGVHAGVGDAIGAGIEFYGEKTDSPNAQEFGRDMRTFQQKIGKEYSDSMSERGQALDQKALFDGVVPNLDGDFLPSLGQKALRSLPGMVVTAPVGGVVAQGIAKAGGAVIPGVAGKIISGAASPVGGNSIRQAIAQQGITRALTDRALALAPTAIGYGGAEGALAGLQSSAQIRSEIEQIPFDQLAETSPLFAKYTDEAGGDMEAARNRLAKEAAEDVAVRTAISTGGFGILTGGGALGGAARAVKASGGKGALIEGAKGFIRGSKEEAIQEFPQSGGEAYITNLAKKKYIDPAIDATDGVLSQAMEGMAVGAATGGVFGGSGGIVRGYRNNQNVGANETGDQSTGEQVSADDIYGAPEQPISAVQPTESDKALYTPKSLTALDRVNEIDTSLVSAPDMPQAEIDALTNEREHITESWPKAAPGAETSFSTETGARLNGQYALMEAGDLTTSHDENLRPVQTYPTELQPRERERHASEMQVQQIVGRLDPARLGESGDVATGAPIVGADGLVESGNARTIALKRVYQANGQKASDYKQFIKDNASRFGIAPESVDAMQKPVLVRIRQTPVNRAEFARQANASTVARMSPSEQAKSDAMQMDSLDDLNPDEQGDFMSGTSRPFVRRFMAKLPVTEQSGLIDSSGQLSQTGYTRIRNAVLAKAYGDSPVLLRMVESVDDDLRNVSKALLRVAPNIAKAREAIGEGALHDADITPDLMAAVEELSELKKKGVSVEDALAQAGIFGDKLSPESKQILMLLNEAARSPRRIAEFIQSYLDALTAAGNPGQEDIFGGKTTPAKSDLMEVARRAVNGEPTTRSTDAENNGVTQEDRSQPQDAQGNQAGNSRNETAEGNPNNEWVAFPQDSGTLGIPRAEMPQIKSEHRGALTQFLKGRGIESRTLDIPAADLKPTQAEFSRKKAAAWKEVRDGVDRSVLASSDGHVLDGHHQWVAALALNEPVKVIQFDAPIKKLLDEVKQFPSVKRSEGGSVDARREAINQQWNEALADLGAIVRDHANVARVIPEDTPGLMPTLVKLFEVGIAEVGHDMKVLMAHVKNALKKIPEFKSVWNKIDNATYRKAALKALDNTDAAPQGDLFAPMVEKAMAAQGDLFSGQPDAKVGDVGAAQSWEDRRKGNFVPPTLKEIVTADVAKRVGALVEKWKDNLPEATISEGDRAKAEALLKPVIDAAVKDEPWFDVRVREIGKQFIGSQLGPTKKIERAAIKLVEESFNVEEMKDIVRATIVVNSYDDAQSALDAITKKFKVIQINNKTDLKISAPEGAKLKNKGVSPEGYSDVTAFVRLPGGGIAEVQINVPEMLSAKLAAHVLYEGSRVVEDDPARQDEYAELRNGQLDVYQTALASLLGRLASDTERMKYASSELQPLETGAPLSGTSATASSSNRNQLPSGNLTNSSPPNEDMKSQPSGNLSGTFISTTSSDRVAQNLDSSYTETENKSRSDSNGQYGKAGSGGAQEQGSGTAQGSQGRRGTQRVRQGQGGGNQFTNDLFGASDSRETGARQDGRPAGENGDNEQRDTGGTRNRASRATGIPAGRDIPAKSGLNYRFSDADLTYEGGWLTKARQNVDAVELIKKLEAEGRQATKDEQAILAKFIGWGASGIRNQIFSTRPWELDKQWKELRERVRGLLTADEMATAERSTQYAHYTSRAVVQSMWKAMDRMGFKGGAILEPGAGIGIFPGLMTPAMATNSVYTGIEFDNITGAILKQLFPDERIAVESFVDSALPDNFYDVAIGNPPFANIPILSDPRYKRLAFSLHDYFFAKSIDKVKPGGLMVYVTSRYTMDKQGDKARKYLSDRAELIGAIRLPQTAFMKNAGTEVVTDVLFLRKFQSSPGGRLGATTDGNNTTRQPWIGVQQIETPEGQATINEYFAAHPEMVLGTHSLKGSMYGKDEYTVLPKEGDIEAQFDAAVENLPKDIYQATGTAAKAAQVREIDFNPKAQKEGNYYLSDAGILMQREGGVGVRADAGKNEKTVALLKDYVRLRDTLLQSHYDQLNDGPWEDSLKALQKAYRDFTKKHGNLLQNKAFERITKKQDEDTGETIEDTVTWRRFDLRNKISDDPDSTLVESLEVLNEETGEITPSPWLSSRILNKPSSPRIETPHDALLSVLNDTGKVDIPLIAERLGIDEQEAIAMLGTAVYESPSAGWQMADEYLSGNVKKKLKEAQESVKTDRRYERNIEALINAQPAPVPPSDITAAIGMNWIPESDYEKFLKEKAGVTAKVTYNERTGQWTVTAKSGASTAAATSDWGTLDRNAADILQHALSGNPIRVTRTEGSGVDKKTVFDAASTEAANQKLAQMREAFADWLWKDGQRTDELTRAYNDKFNTTVSRSFDGRHLTLPGKTSTINVFDHVKRGAWRIIQSGNTYLAHSVGAGKTWAAVISAMEQKRLGLIKKPMMVVPNHMLQQFAREWLQLYPTAKLMVADEKQFHTDNRRRFVSRVALSDVDGVIITHSAFKLLDLDPEFKEKMITEQLDYLRAALEEAGGEEGQRSRDPKVRDIQNRIEKMEQKLESAMSSDGKDKNVRFDQLGVDQIYVDEAHEFRKLAFTTLRQVKGIDSSGSDRAFDLWMKTRWLEQKKPGRSLVMMSGTPITNTLAELYSVQRFMSPQALEDRGLQDFDAWASMFGQENTEIEADASGKYSQVTRFTKFVNVPEMTQMFREFSDVLTADHLAVMLGDKRPKVKNGSRSLEVTPQTEDYSAYKEALALRLEESRAWKPSQGEPNNPDPIIRIIGDGRLAAIDMRFVDPSLPSDPDSKLNKMIDGVIEVYRRTANNEYMGKDGQMEPDKGGSQMVFSDLGFGAGVTANRGFNARAWMEKRLRDAGIPAKQVAFMGDHKKSTAKLKLFKDVNAGRVRILVGSSKNMGTGVNAQQRLIALHHLDTPWYPADLEQREGRIIRQGNKNPLVEIYAFSTKGSYDAVMWQMLASKQQFIDQALSGDTSVRSIDDLSDVSQFQIATAMTAGDPRAIQLAGIKADISKYQRLFRAHEETRSRLRHDYDLAGEWIASADRQLPAAEKMAKKVVDLSGENFKARAGDKVFDKRKEWAEALLAKFKESAAHGKDGRFKIGEISSFPIEFFGKIVRDFDDKVTEYRSQLGMTLGEEAHVLVRDVNDDPVGISMRATNTLAALARKPSELKQRIEDAKAKRAALVDRLDAKFQFAQELSNRISEADALEAAMMADQASDENTDQQDNSTDTPRLSRADNPLAGGVSIASVGQEADNILGGLGNAPDVKVVWRPSDLPFDAPSDTRGAMYKGTLYLVAGGIRSAEDVREVTFHELAHFGLRGFFGSALDAALGEIHDANPRVRLMAAAWRSKNIDLIADLKSDYSLSDNDIHYISIDEALAKIAQTGESLKGWKRFAAVLQSLLRSMGLHRLANSLEAKTDAEALLMLKKAELFATRGLTAKNYMPEAAYPLFMTAYRGKAVDTKSTGRGMALRDLHAVVDRVSKGFKNLPRVHVFASPADLSTNDQTQKALRDFIKKSDAWNDVEGATHEGEIYLFASGMADEARAEHVLATHEITHYGLRGAVGKELDSALQHVLLMNAKVRKAAIQMRDARGLKSNLDAVEEVLADIPDVELAKLRGWRKVVQVVRNWLNKAGAKALAAKLDVWMKSGLSDQEKADVFVADLLMAAREWGRTGRGVNSGMAAMGGTRLAKQKLADDMAAGFATGIKKVIADSVAGQRLSMEPIHVMDHTPTTLRAFGWGDLPVSMNPKEIDKVHFDHGMTADRIAQLVPGTLDSPSLMLRSATQEGNMVMVANEYGAKPVLLVIKPDADTRAGKRQLVVSMYPKDEGWDWVARQIRSGNLLYRDPQSPVATKISGAVTDAQKRFAQAGRPMTGLIPEIGIVRSKSGNLSDAYKILLPSDLRKMDADGDSGNPMFSRAVSPAPTSAKTADDIINQKAGTSRPLDYIAKGITQAAQIDKLTMAAYNKAGFLLDRWTPETIKAGMVSDYGIPEAVIDQRAIVQGRQKRQLRAAGTLLEKLSTLTRAESRIAYEWMNTDNPQSSDWFMEQLPPESIKTLAEVEKMIDGLSKEAVRLGQLDEEAYKRNRFAYLHRSYAKHTAELTGGETAARKRAIAVLGDQYKGRGMTDAVDMAKIKNGSPEWWNRKTQQGKADKQLKGERFIRLERRASSGEGTAAIPGMSDKSKGRLLEVAYWPAGEAIPARYGAWDQMGTWEVRDTKGNNLIVWRDFTKQERELMGEIDEARYAIAKTLHGMIHDVETGKYLQWLGQKYAKIDGEAIDGKIVEASDRMRDIYKTGEWVKVPDVVVPGTKVKRYGALAGRYLPAPIWNDVRQTVGFRYQPLGETYAAIHRAWKTSKTSLSPAVHMNNVMANFVMADWHDVTAGHVLKALRLMTSKDAAADEVLARFGDSGGSIGTWATKELQQEQLRPLLDALEKELGIAGNVTGQVSVMSALQLALKGRFPSAWDALKPSAAGKITVKTARAMIDLYEAEDQVFRLAAWLKAKEDGATDQVAGKVARKSFLDYSINAPWVQMMRSTALPFVAFTYRAAPMMLEIAAKKPWKLIKLGLLAGAINALGYMLSGGDEDDERKLLPEEKAGRIWGITPKLIRMPWNDANGSPVFLDIRRWIPVGDIFDTGQSHAALPILPSMTPGGPLALMAELMLNKQGFTGKAITLETDTASEQAEKLTDYLYKAFAPNIAILPGTYAWTGIANAGSGKTDSFGREQSLAQSIISSVGVKLGSYPPDVLRLNAQRAAQAKMMEIDKNITALKREFQKKGIDRDEFNAKAKAQIEKKQAVEKEFMERVAGS